MIQISKPELLAPAGDFERLCAAVEYGADAVLVTATVDDRVYGPLAQYDIAPKERNDDEW